MVYIYGSVLVVAAGVFGTFCRSVLMGLGFVPDLGAGLYILLGAGSVYLFCQCMFMSALRLFQPTASPTVYFSEMASNAATLVLVPFILHVDITLPHELLEKMEPLIFLGAFLVVHLFLKLSTYYASMQGVHATRKPSVAFFVAGCIFLFAGIFCETRWVSLLENSRMMAADASESIAFASVYAMGLPIQEGASLTRTTEPKTGQTITARFAPMTDTTFDTIHATVEMQGDDDTVYQSSTTLTHGVWSEIRVPNEYVPDGLRSYDVRWTLNKEPNWQRILGLRPIVYNLPTTPGTAPLPPRHVMMSGPYVHAQRGLVREPNIVLILIDGLAANHLTMMNYERSVTPSLDRLGYSGLAFPNMFSPSASVNESLQALFTGIADPVKGKMAINQSLVSALSEAGYSTVAFTEGDNDGRRDLVHGSGFESGFELFDESFHAEEGSGATVKKAQNWIDDHDDVAFFVTIRLRGLEDLSTLTNIEGPYPTSGPTRPVDVFDNALQVLDSQIGSLLKSIRDHEMSDQTFIIVTSPYGHAFSIQSDGRMLEEHTLRTPLIVSGPGVSKTKVSTQVEMIDVTATIANLAGVKFPGSTNGKSVL